MLDHVGFPVGELATAKAFFVRALAPLGIELLVEVSAEQTGGGAHAGFGAEGWPFFWIGDSRPATGSVHVAFRARDRAAVETFHRAALASGGRDNGAPGLRPHYHPDYYGAFVVDPDGNNIEAVCHAPPEP